MVENLLCESLVCEIDSKRKSFLLEVGGLFCCTMYFCSLMVPWFVVFVESPRGVYSPWNKNELHSSHCHTCFNVNFVYISQLIGCNHLQTCTGAKVKKTFGQNKKNIFGKTSVVQQTFSFNFKSTWCLQFSRVSIEISIVP